MLGGCAAEVKRVLKKIQTAEEENTKSSESQRKGDRQKSQG